MQQKYEYLMTSPAIGVSAWIVLYYRSPAPEARHEQGFPTRN